MKLLEPIKSMGLDEKEAKIYLTLLQLKKATAYYVALKSGLKKTTTYATLDDLVDKGFALKIPDEKKALYMAKSPGECVFAMQQKINTVKEILPELLAIQKKEEDKTKISYYQGIEGIKEVYNDTLKYSGELVGFGSEDIVNLLGDDWAKQYLKNRVKHKIPCRAVFARSEYIEKELVTKDEEQLRITKFAEKKELPFSIEIDIYGGNKISLISGKEVMATIIESKEIHDALKSIFEFVWKKLPDKNS